MHTYLHSFIHTYILLVHFSSEEKKNQYLLFSLSPPKTEAEKHPNPWNRKKCLHTMTKTQHNLHFFSNISLRQQSQQGKSIILYSLCNKHKHKTKYLGSFLNKTWHSEIPDL